jgi:hypothetical protein
MFWALTGRKPTPDDMRAVADMLRDDGDHHSDDARDTRAPPEPLMQPGGSNDDRSLAVENARTGPLSAGLFY